MKHNGFSLWKERVWRSVWGAGGKRDGWLLFFLRESGNHKIRKTSYVLMSSLWDIMKHHVFSYISCEDKIHSFSDSFFPHMRSHYERKGSHVSWLWSLPWVCHLGFCVPWLWSLPWVCHLGFCVHWLWSLPWACHLGCCVPWLWSLPWVWLQNE